MHNKALSAGERGGKIEYIEEVPAGVFAFTRSVEGNSVTVYANLTNEAVVVGDTTIAAWGWNIITK